jgi:hypothetical protein
MRCIEKESSIRSQDPKNAPSIWTQVMNAKSAGKLSDADRSSTTSGSSDTSQSRTPLGGRPFRL